MYPIYIEPLEIFDCLFHNLRHSQAINIMHGINFYTFFLDYLFFTRIEGTNTDHHYVLPFYFRCKTTDVYQAFMPQAKTYRQRHAMNIPGWCGRSEERRVGKEC